MSGILDKKSRIMDYVITENGREQMESGDIRFVYASLSDKSIIYTKDHELSKIKKANISNSENEYMPFETDTKISDDINPEFDLQRFFARESTNIRSSSQIDNDVSFLDALQLSNQTLGKSLSNLKLLTTKSILNNSSSLTFKNTGRDSSSFELLDEDLLRKYPTLVSLKEESNNLNIIADDKRFSHKTNFMSLIPVDDLTGEELYPESDFPSLTSSSNDSITDFIYKGFKDNNVLNEYSNREDLIVDVVRSIKSNESVFRRVYELENTSEFSSFIFELYENNQDGNLFEKLSFIRLGNFFDKKENKSITVYLIGKIINSRTSQETKDLNMLFKFDNGKIDDTQKNKNFALSAFYSFVCLFTLVIEE